MSKNSLLDKIEVKTPCSENWDEMRGNDKTRFCSHCAFEVNNLSAMTHKEALKIVRRSDGRICVRYVKNPETNAPVFRGKLYQIGRRTGIAASVLGASLSLSSMTYAQGGIDITNIVKTDTEVSQSKKSDKDKMESETESETTSVSGTIVDSQGAVVPNISVTLTNKETGESRVVTSSNEGFYEFKNAAPGIYTLKTADNYGFKAHSIENVNINGSDVKQDISLDVSQVVMTMGDMIMVEPGSPLHKAVSSDDLDEVKDLITRGEKVNFKDENYGNITPLFLAVENGNLEITETLLNFGAKVNARDENRQTPLMRLDSDASPEIVALLIKHGAKVNAADNDGDTALILASSDSSPEVLKALAASGANVNAQNKEGQTALMNAAEEDNPENVRALIMAGANVNTKNEEGETAWDLASDEEIKKLLESHGAKVKVN
jgi:hypothetical protein